MRKRNLFTLLLACCLLLSLPLSASAATEPTSYSITAQELAQLKSNLTQLESNNESSQQELQQLKTQLRASQEQLEQAEQRSQALQEQLKDLTTQSAQAENLLASANQSLTQYKQEEQAKLNKAKQQRNLWLALAGSLLIYCVVK